MHTYSVTFYYSIFNFHIHTCKGNKHDSYSVILYAQRQQTFYYFFFSDYSYKVNKHITVQSAPTIHSNKTNRDLEDIYGIISRKGIDNTISKGKRDRK